MARIWNLDFLNGAREREGESILTGGRTDFRSGGKNENKERQKATGMNVIKEMMAYNELDVTVTRETREAFVAAVDSTLRFGWSGVADADAPYPVSETDPMYCYACSAVENHRPAAVVVMRRKPETKDTLWVSNIVGREGSRILPAEQYNRVLKDFKEKLEHTIAAVEPEFPVTLCLWKGNSAKG
jgi:hypothetical protein